MQVFYSLDDFTKPENGCVLTVGNFDGVHVGHQAIIKRARQLADAESLPLIVLTFEPAPVRLLRPDKPPRLLSPLEIKIPLLRQLGLDHLVVIEPTEELMALTPEQFTNQIIVDRLAARHVVEGQTFSFGRHRSGTIVTLQKLGRKLGFETHLVPASTLTLADTPAVAISSTLVRQQIAIGRLDLATKCLGRFYTLFGRIIRGRGQGRRLGFPTTNIKLHTQDQLAPEDGVFAGYARFGDNFDKTWAAQKIRRAAVSIGRCETFTDSAWQIEAYLLNYPENGPDLLDKCILLSLVEKTRPQFRYDSTRALTRAIEADCRDINLILQKKGTPEL